MAKPVRYQNKDISAELLRNIENNNENVDYKRRLDYITIDSDFFKSNDMRNLYEKYILFGRDLALIQLFLRCEMGDSPSGYYCDISDDKIEMIISDAAYYLKMDRERVKECINTLIKEGFLLKVSFNGKEILTSARQVWNYMILNEKRINSRLASQKYRDKMANKDDAIEKTTKSIEPEPSACETLDFFV